MLENLAANNISPQIKSQGQSQIKSPAEAAKTASVARETNAGCKEVSLLGVPIYLDRQPPKTDVAEIKYNYTSPKTAVGKVKDWKEYEDGQGTRKKQQELLARLEGFMKKLGQHILDSLRTT